MYFNFYRRKENKENLSNVDELGSLTLATPLSLTPLVTPLLAPLQRYENIDLHPQMPLTTPNTVSPLPIVGAEPKLAGNEPETLSTTSSMESSKDEDNIQQDSPEKERFPYNSRGFLAISVSENTTDPPYDVPGSPRGQVSRLDISLYSVFKDIIREFSLD